MLGQKFITRTRRLFDRALTSLPVTQHERVWPLYLKASSGGGWSKLVMHGFLAQGAPRMARV